MPTAPRPTKGHGRETDHNRGEFGHASRDEALVALALPQHAVFSLDQFRGLGFTDRAVDYRVATARLHRIHQSVYSLVPRELLSRHGHWMAAVLACGPQAFLSHRTAGALHELRPSARAKIDVTVVGRCARKRAGIDLHRSTKLTEADVTRVNGIPCTTVHRALLDMAAVLPRRTMERAFDQAEIAELFDLIAITDQLERNPNHRGARLVRSILAEHYIGSTPTANELDKYHGTR